MSRLLDDPVDQGILLKLVGPGFCLLARELGHSLLGLLLYLAIKPKRVGDVLGTGSAAR